MLSNEDYSFVAVRHLRHVMIEDRLHITEVTFLMMELLTSMADCIEWTECDEILSQQISIYVQRSNNPSCGLDIRSR